jgi:hypothetical protein
MQRTLTPMKTRSRQFIAQHFKENVDPLGLAANAGSVFLFVRFVAEEIHDEMRRVDNWPGQIFVAAPVIVHELLHLRVRNHGKLFRALALQRADLLAKRGAVRCRQR